VEQNKDINVQCIFRKKVDYFCSTFSKSGKSGKKDLKKSL